MVNILIVHFIDYVSEKECIFIGIPVMIITNIININNGNIYRKYINALNIVNCLLNGTFKTSSINNIDVDTHSIDLCCLLLSYQLIQDDDDDDDELPKYVRDLLNEYCINLNDIVIFWDDMEIIGNKIKNLLCNHDHNTIFFNFNIILRLFPNLQQIEYFNTSSSKSIIKQIIQYISSNNYTQQTNFKYVIIHHNYNTKLLIDNNHNNTKRRWNIYQDTNKIILYNHMYQLDVNSLNIRFDSRKILKNL